MSHTKKGESIRPATSWERSARQSTRRKKQFEEKVTIRDRAGSSKRKGKREPAHPSDGREKDTRRLLVRRKKFSHRARFRREKGKGKGQTDRRAHEKKKDKFPSFGEGKDAVRHLSHSDGEKEKCVLSSAETTFTLPSGEGR